MVRNLVLAVPRRAPLETRYPCSPRSQFPLQPSRIITTLPGRVMPILQTELAKWGKVQEARIEERRAAKLSAATPLTIVARDNGQPYTDDGFGSIWNRAQHDCGCAGLPFHGLRKNATQALFEAGCTPQQVQAITGHQTLEMVAYYGKGANQALLARQAISKLKQVD
jgi:integrase